MQDCSQLNNHIIICGYGRNGEQASNNLFEQGAQVIVIEKDRNFISRFEEKKLHYIIGDATQDDTLIKANIKKAKALITSLPVDADNLYVVLTARQANPTLTIVSRALNINSNSKLKKAGADFVIIPDLIGGQHMAKLVAQPDIVEFLDKILLQNKKEVNLEELSCSNISSELINKSIGELKIRNVSGANIIGIKTETGNFIFNPSHDVKLSKKDKIFVLGTNQQITKLINILLFKKDK